MTTTGATRSRLEGGRRALDVVASGSTTGIGSLPHRNARQAAAFALDSYDIAAIPTLPRRSPAESSLAQALTGVPGVTFGQYGTVAIDAARLDPAGEVVTRVGGDSFVGLRAFLDEAQHRGHVGPVKWQFVGPISVGVALRRAGAAPEVAFAVALHAVQRHLRHLADVVACALPESPQIVVVDEPFAGDVMAHDFPLAPDEAIDLLSSAMATLESEATVGVHCCGTVDLATLLHAGPSVLSLPATKSLIPHAGNIDRYLGSGGWIAWGAVATEGPIGVTSRRSWHQLVEVWSGLVARGCDPDRLLTQALLTPECGLGTHSTSVAERVCHILADLARTCRSTASSALRVDG